MFNRIDVKAIMLVPTVDGEWQFILFLMNIRRPRSLECVYDQLENWMREEKCSSMS